jgi:hypothetical protein
VDAAVVGAAVVGAAVVGAAVDGAAVVDDGSAALELPPVPLQAASASVAASQNATTASPRARCANLFTSPPVASAQYQLYMNRDAPVVSGG